VSSLVRVSWGIAFRASVAAALVVVALAAAPLSRAGAAPGLGARATVARTPTTIGFWAGEAVPGTDWHDPGTYWARRDTHAYTPYLWRVLRRYRIPLYLNLRYERDFGPVPPGEPQRHDALRIIRTANRLGIPVQAWVLIPFADGYWAWEGAAAEQLRAVRALVGWAHEKQVRLSGIALDPEPRLLTPYTTSAAIMGGSGGGALASAFGSTINPLAQCAAWHVYSRIPRWASRHGYPVSAAPMPAALDDIEDGNLALQDASDFLVPEAGWHDLFFQAYRSVFAYYSDHDPGPGIVASYFRSAQSAFGSTGQVSIGSAGRGPYRSFASLLHDVRLAATLGAHEVPIYSLERTLRAYGGPGAVAQLARAAAHPFAGPGATRSTAPTPRAATLRAAVRRADKAAATITRTIAGPSGTASPNPWPRGCGQTPAGVPG
jgi:hypothetical protein